MKNDHFVWAGRPVKGIVLASLTMAAVGLSYLCCLARPAPPLVRVTPVVERSWPVWVGRSATVLPSKIVSVSARVGGVIWHHAVQSGQSVTAGMLLLELDSAPYERAVDQAAARQAGDYARLDAVRRELARDADPAAVDYVPPETVQARRAQAERLQAVVHDDAVLLARARLDLASTRIVAPVAGRVMWICAVGNKVQPANQEIVTIAPLGPARISVNPPRMPPYPLVVEARDSVSGLVLARGCTLHPGGSPLDLGTVTRFAVACPQSDELQVGETIAIFARYADAAIATVPRSALLPRAGGVAVAAVQDGVIAMRLVTIVEQEGAQVALGGAPSKGTMIVTESNDRLQDGMPVRTSPAR